ncbi:hypothetical protein FE391_35095 [Nonomuraea sp. KC401]|uniref:hypothetical protein n=1 Tax=unclassified Nonomuraea TaxID=2593643 RepID=UPI0010FE8581|nr:MULTISPECIES: hypothetical protein [unclassified Nonomuraea]NBE98922.1 hypothetical protein [Nonomuraea sp. K271]TLF59309.1 hypothetical protein FE391_35095 [Nonomuraea sp. KC401]
MQLRKVLPALVATGAAAALMVGAAPSAGAQTTTQASAQSAGYPRLKCSKVTEKGGWNSYRYVTVKNNCKRTLKANVEWSGKDSGWVAISKGTSHTFKREIIMGAYGVKMYYKGKRYNTDL